MASRMKNNTPPKTNHALRWVSILLSFLGAADALYLWIYKLSSNDKMCLGSGDCHTVNYSSYSTIYGIPVAFLGLLAYLVILAILLLEPRWKLAATSGPLAVFGMGLVGFLFSAYLTLIEFFVIHAVCPFCVASAGVMTLIFSLAIIRLVKNIS
jgi:uncharacterized membrane protein